MRALQLTVAACALLSLSGCFSGPTASTWDCPAPQGMGCVSISQADAGRPEYGPPAPTDTQHAGQTPAPPVKTDLELFFAGASKPPREFDQVVSDILGSARTRLVCPRGSEGPCRTPELVAAIYVAGYEDRSGNWIDPTFIYTVVRPPSWTTEKP
jgi:type IV conjugative transfer system lipoprotein TraV